MAVDELCICDRLGTERPTAAITLARAGVATTVLEAQSTIGGGARSAELTLPGFVHDICAAVLAVSSPAFATFPLAEHGLDLILPPAPLAHPLDGGRAVLVDRSLDVTSQRLGKDGPAYHRSIAPLVAGWDQLAPDFLGPLGWPKHPWLFARFGMLAPWPATVAARTLFRMPETRAMFAGMAGHSVLPLDKSGSGVFGWVLAITAHATGWPIARGGTQSVTNALASYFESLGGTIVKSAPVHSLDELKDADAILCDMTPRQLLPIAANRLPARSAASSRSIVMVPARSRWIGRSTARFRGLPLNARKPRRYT